MLYTLSQLKEILDGLGYNLGPDGLNGNYDNSLDMFTQAAIQELQLHYHLAPTGRLDLTTDQLVRQLIRSLQRNLNQLVDANLPVNEFYGPRMVQAIRTFQHQYGLPITGVAGAMVRQKLEEIVNAQLRTSA